MFKLSAAVAAVLLVAGPAMATDSAVDNPASIRVSAADLDLSRSGDQQILKSRVAKAIAEACNPRGIYSADLTMDQDCAREIAAKADMRILSISSASASAAAPVASRP